MFQSIYIIYSVPLPLQQRFHLNVPFSVSIVDELWDRGRLRKHKVRFLRSAGLLFP